MVCMLRPSLFDSLSRSSNSNAGAADEPEPELWRSMVWLLSDAMRLLMAECREAGESLMLQSKMAARLDWAESTELEAWVDWPGEDPLLGLEASSC